jgi:MFS family permease
MGGEDGATPAWSGSYGKWRCDGSVARSDLLSLSLYQLLASNRSGIFIVYFPLFLTQSKGASVPVALAFLSSAYVAASLLSPLAGRLSDRVGRRQPFLLIAEVGALPLFLAVGFVPGYLWAGTMFLLAQVVLSIGAPALSAYVGDLSREHERGHGYGLLNATSSAGAMAGFVITAFLVTDYGYPSLFPFVAAVMAINVVVVVTLIPDRRSARGLVRQPWREYRPLLWFSFLVSVRSLGAGATGTFFGVLAAELGASPLEIAAIALVGLGTGAVVSVPLGRMVDRGGEIRAIWYGTLITLLGTFGFLFATSWVHLLPALVLRYIGYALLSPGMLAWVANRAPSDHRAEHLGVFSLVNSTFWSLGPLAGGAMLTVGGNDALFAFALGTTIFSLIAIEAAYLRRGWARRPTRPAVLVAVAGTAPALPAAP